ncbi:MAG: membrane protein insertase YidC [Rubrobacteraceae bacterium]
MIELLGSLFDPLVTLLGSGLQLFHGWGAPWWLSIVMLTVVVRTVLFPLTIKQVKNVRQIQELKPELDEIREKYGDNPQKQQSAMMELYTDRKINPLGGCLPLVVQMPIFLGLFYTIKEFENLQSFTSGGLLWFQDLTAADPFFVLPVIFVLTMMASQEISLRNTAPQQRRLMRFLPVVFGSFMALGNFPAGLFVYWIANNFIALVQNILIYHPLENNAIDREQRE